MCCEFTKTRAIIVTIAETIVVGALTTGAIIGAIAVGSTLATVALSVGAAVAGIFTLLSIGNTVLCFSTKFNVKIRTSESLWADVHKLAVLRISDLFHD